MANESLGTMVVGVTADISPAERAMTRMSELIEDLDRKITNTSRSRGTKPLGDSFDKQLADASARLEAQLAREEQAESRSRSMESSLEKAMQKMQAEIGSPIQMSELGPSRDLGESYRKAIREGRLGAAEAIAAETDKFEREYRVFVEDLEKLAVRAEKAKIGILGRPGRMPTTDVATGPALPSIDAAEESDKADKRNADAKRKAVDAEIALQQAANRARFAVLNLGYGVQDAVTVFGSGGFAGAIRASANNLQGLGVLLDNTQGGMDGLKKAVFSAEFAVVGIATAALVAADAWDKYQKSLQKAAEENAKAKFEKFDAPQAGREAARGERFAVELEGAREVKQAEEQVKRVRDDDRVKAAQERAEARKAADLRLEKQKAELALAQKAAADLKAQALARQGAMGGQGGAAGFERMQQMTAEERKLAESSDLQLKADLAEATRKLKEAEDSVNSTIEERIQLLKEQDAAEKNLRRARRDDVEERFNRQFAEGMREMQANAEEAMRAEQGDIEYRLQFLGRRRREITEQNRNTMRPVGAAGFESAEAYESLARSRMRGDPQTDLLQKIAREEEKATKALEDIRERLDPGRRARIAVLEALD